MSECESYGSSEGLSSHQGNNKLPVRPTQTSLGVLEVRPHLPVTRSSSGPHDQRGQTQPQSSLHQRLSDQSGAISSENLVGRTGHPVCPLIKVRTHGLIPPYYSGQLRETHISHSTPSLFTYKPDPQTPQQAQTVDTADGPGEAKGPGAPDWQTERWHIWQILSKDNEDTLTETLVWCTTYTYMYKTDHFRRTGSFCHHALCLNVLLFCCVIFCMSVHLYIYEFFCSC